MKGVQLAQTSRSSGARDGAQRSQGDHSCETGLAWAECHEIPLGIGCMAMLKRDTSAVAIWKGSSHRPNPLDWCVTGSGWPWPAMGACTFSGFAIKGGDAFGPSGLLPDALFRMGWAIHRMFC